MRIMMPSVYCRHFTADYHRRIRLPGGISGTGILGGYLSYHVDGG